MTYRRRAGFSLAEFVITILIVAGVVGFSAPHFQSCHYCDLCDLLRQGSITRWRGGASARSLARLNVNEIARRILQEEADTGRTFDPRRLRKIMGWPHQPMMDPYNRLYRYDPDLRVVASLGADHWLDGWFYDADVLAWLPGGPKDTGRVVPKQRRVRWVRYSYSWLTDL